MKRTKIRNILLSALLALTVGMPTLSFADEGASAESGASGAGATPYAAGDKNTVADPNTASTWRNWGLDYSTQSVGRIWTDKTVSTEGIELTGADGTITIKKSPEADFLTAFSALSSTSNLKSTVAQPLDIVLVLDASGSMDDRMGSGDNTKRIDALKAAANSFIDEIAKQNVNISDPAQQHRVSLVKFAGKISNRVGNDTYREDGYNHNYSQVMKNLTSCVGSLADDLKSTVDKIEPAGATRADYGLELAAEQTSGRKDAKKIVVFFTDGSPTSHSDFNSSVASRAVSAAKSMKDAGATIYSVGIFSGANPSADLTASGTSDENKFMHAVSSNYPADAAAASEAGALATGAGDAAKGEGSAPADAGAAPAPDTAADPAAKPAGDGPTTDNSPAEASTLVFHYTITEKAGGHADVTNDPNPAFTFEVTVTRDNAGNVTANVTNVQDYVKGMPLRTFTNTYTYTPYTPPVIPDPDPIFAAPVAKKILEGRAIVAGEFSFELLENGKVVSTGTNDADGNVVFSDIKFTEAGTHIYTMREIGAGTTAAGVTYDTTTYQVTATVVKIGNELRVDFAIDGADGAVFKNAYAAKGTTVIIGATKTLEGRTLAAGEFTFKLTGADGRTYEAKNAADGRIGFPAIDFDKVGTYDFTLVEMNDGQAGITYDGRSYKVTVVVTDDGKGNLVANVTWPNGTPPTFKNTYTKPVPAVAPSTPGMPGTPGKPSARFAKTGDAAMPIACVATLAILAAGAVGAAAFGALRKREKGDERQ